MQISPHGFWIMKCLRFDDRSSSIIIDEMRMCEAESCVIESVNMVDSKKVRDDSFISEIEPQPII